MQGANLLYSGLIFAEGMLLLWTAGLLAAAVLLFGRRYCDRLMTALWRHWLIAFRSPDHKMTGSSDN